MPEPDARFDPRTPVLVGVGQSIRRPDGADPPVEPVELMAEAVRAAAADTGAPRDGTAVTAGADSIRVSQLISWRYRDPGRLVAERVGATPAESLVTVIGGNYVQTMVNRTCADIVAGRHDLVLITGAEAWRTRVAARTTEAGRPDWTVQDEGVALATVIGDLSAMTNAVETDLGIIEPTIFYPLVESALRAAAGRSIEEHRAHLGRLWSRFSEVAEANPWAWIRHRYTPDELTTPSPENRMVGFPYPKLLNSNLFVDQGAALIVCSAERATALGIPRERWVFVHAGTDAQDHWFPSDRDELHASPAIRLAGRAALDLAATAVGDLGPVDLYSCFPSAVQVAAAELGLGTDRDLTVTGGMSFAGGPFNNYPMHAVATIAGRLRDEPGSRGLVSANGGFLTKHAFGVYSTEPPAAGVFRHADLQAEVDALPTRTLDEHPAGPATVEAYTVVHARDGQPERAVLALRMPDGRRAWGASTDEAAMRALCREEGVGRAAHVDAKGDVNLP